MKNIEFYASSIYDSDDYTEIEPMIYRTELTNEPDDSDLALVSISDDALIAALSARTDWEIVDDDEYDDDDDDDDKLMFLVHKGKKYYRQNMTYFILDPDEYGTKTYYSTSLKFEQEPEFGENEPQDDEISQYPLEDLLDEFNLCVGDSYETENSEDKVHAYLEFMSEDAEDIRKLLGVIGKHVYNAEDGACVKLVIE